MAAEPIEVMRKSSPESALTRKPLGQATHSVGRCSGLTLMQIRRVVESLEAGHAERNIAESEQISERIVRRIRQLELDRRSRQMSAVGVAVGSMLDNVRVLHSEIDGSVFEELTEGAA